MVGAKEEWVVEGVVSRSVIGACSNGGLHEGEYRKPLEYPHLRSRPAEIQHRIVQWHSFKSVVGEYKMGILAGLVFKKKQSLSINIPLPLGGYE